MSSLRSALDELKDEDIRRRADEELEGDVLELQRTADVLLAERLRRIAEIERRRTYRRDGYLSTSAWLADRANISFATAKRDVCTAQALEKMPVAREALAQGEISTSAVQVLVAAKETNPEEFREAEETLVDAARELSVKELSATAAGWTR